MNETDVIAFWLTLKLALVTTGCLLFVCGPIAWWLSRTQWRFKYIVEVLLAMPLVLPPTVLGFYLLLMLGPNGPLGQMSLFLTGETLAFSFSGLVIGSMIYSLPFVVQPLQHAFAGIERGALEAAATLGAPKWDVFYSIILPMAKPGILSATALGFAHTLGEFGVVLMIGGNIPGETQVVSIAIYDHVESLQYAQAHWLSLSLVTVSFFLLLLVYGFNRQARLRVV
jgi:molybdate transport system permease protein